MSRRVLVCGGRKYADRETVMRVLNDVAMIDNDRPMPEVGFVVIHGGATGADSLADEWAVINWVDTEVYKPDWKLNGRAAGPIRNQRMIDVGKPTLVVAFPGGAGTADMVRRAKAAGVEVRLVDREAA